MGKDQASSKKGSDAAVGGEHVKVTMYCQDPYSIGYFTSSDAFDGGHSLAGGTATNSYDQGPKWIKWAIGIVQNKGDLANWTLDASCRPDGHEFQIAYIGPYSRGGPDMYGYISDYFRTVGSQADIKVVIDRTNQIIRCGYSGINPSEHR